MTGKVLHSLADLNGDGIADLVVFNLSGRDISSKRSSYEVHFGTPTSDGGIVFSRGVDIAFQSDDRIQIGMSRHDFNRDGQVDLMITTIDIEFLKGSLWKSIKGFMGDDVWLDLEFYQMKEGGYPGTPTRPAESPWTECQAIASQGGCHWTSCFEGGRTRAGTPKRVTHARSTQLCASGM